MQKTVCFQGLYPPLFDTIEHDAERHFVHDPYWAVTLSLGGKFFGKGRTVRKLTGDGIRQKPLIKRILTDGVRRKDKKNLFLLRVNDNINDYLELAKSFTVKFLRSIAV